MIIRQKLHSVVSFKQKKRENVKKGESLIVSFGSHFLERECLPSLKVSEQSDRRQSSEQEGKLFYAERASRGYRI